MPDAQPRQKNPFVGPRSFEEGEQLYGRKRETIELTNLLIAERIILLYSPSGAGKTSLIRAALLPKLRQRHFAPLPTMRVNLEPPPEFAGQPGFNRYTFSLLSSLEADQPETAQKPEAELARLSLADYLDERTAQPEGSAAQADTVLVFDQFEEILTIDAADVAQKQAFFDQLSAALKDPNRWALFSMREDYIAGLDPYLLAIPTHLRNTFRLDLLSRDTARHVLQQTTQQSGVSFADEAAERLIDDLSRVRVQKLDGSIEDRPGVSVEPVQLQVVCYNLWDRLPSEVNEITLTEIKALGDVDQALGDYYSTQVAAVAQRLQIPERNLRRWFDEALITPSGIRNQVLLEQSIGQGIDHEAIYRLEDVHLVRLETVRNRTWVELAHDRLVAPVRLSNADWFEENLSVLQRQAGRWLAENRAEHLLLRGESLVQAQDWAREHADELLPEESEFLSASQDAQEKEQAEQQLAEAARRSKTQRRFIIFITLALLAAVVFGINSAIQTVRANSQANLAQLSEADAKTQAIAAQATGVYAQTQRAAAEAGSTAQAELAAAAQVTGVYAEIQKATAEAASTLAVANADEARTQADLAFSRQLAAQGSSLLANQPELAANLAVESFVLAPSWENKSLLLGIVQRQEQQTVQQFGPALPDASSEISAFAVSPDGARLAWGTITGRVTVWNYQTNDFEPGWDDYQLQFGNILSLAFSPDGSQLASGGARPQQLFITDIKTQERTAELDANNQSRALAFHPTKPILAVAINNRLEFWDTTNWQKSKIGFVEEADQINDIAWSPDGNLLAYSLSADKATPNDGLGLWSLKTNGVLKHFPQSVPLYQISWSQDGNLLAAASRDGAVLFFDTINLINSTLAEVPRVNQPVFAVAFNPDGKIFVRGDADIGLTVFSAQDFEEIKTIESEPNGWVRFLEFYPEPGFNLLGVVNATTANRHWVSLYLVNPREPLGTVRQAAKENVIRSLAVDTQGQVWLARQTEEGIQVVSEDGQTSIFEQTGTFNVVALSPDGSRLALWRTDGPVEVYDLTTRKQLQSLTLDSEFLPQYTPSLAFSQDGETLTVGVCLQEMESENGNRVCQLPDLQFWEISTGTETRSMKSLFGPSTAPDLGIQAYFPDGDAIATGNADGSINLFTLGFSNEPALLLQGPPRPVTSLAFSPDGTLMASGSRDGSLVLWDRDSYQTLGSPFNPGRLGITALAFSADSHSLLAAYEDGSLMAWNVDPEAWVNLACEVAVDSLDEDQQARYFPNGGYRDICATRRSP
ncbi:MAG: hypothetical protein ACK2UW_11855 [Anaerolineales bacterium]